MWNQKIKYPSLLSNLLAVSGLVFVDQLTKAWARMHFPIQCNAGVAFSFPLGRFWILILTIVAIGVLLYLLMKQIHWQNSLPIIFILAGAIGNLIDRLRVGCVTDFLTWPIGTTFNLADSLITAGVILWLIFLLRRKEG